MTWYAVSCAVAFVDVINDPRAVGGIKAAQDSVEIRLIGGVDRVEHAAKFVVKSVLEVRGAPQQVVGRIPLLVKKQLVELRDGGRKLLDLGLTQLDWIRRQDVVELSKVMRSCCQIEDLFRLEFVCHSPRFQKHGNDKSRPLFIMLTAYWYSSYIQVV